MKKILLFFISIHFHISSSQNILIEFQFNVNSTFELASVSKKSILKQDDKFSIFELKDIRDVRNFKHHESITTLKERDTVTFFNVNDQGFACLFKEQCYKDFEKNIQIDSKIIGLQKTVFIEDQINLFNWELIQESDTIISGYNCKKAKTNFRGRNYIAHYTNEIANQGGPWKFDGLPGFILSVKSLDGFISIEPTEIKINTNQNKQIKNPYENKKTIKFDKLYMEFLNQERKNFAKAKSKNPYLEQTKAGPLESIEIIEELQKERIYE